ncbi:uncharacterized protein LOC110117270 [Athalia rosae]|uniref:uncharacterized protein LOC110117270 n=1 Tax=Athalia rosae TaxID=37344 RepID=UPI002033FFC7|nr:uncharacterized protein LOC110117270 [Athalia rosae]
MHYKAFEHYYEFFRTEIDAVNVECAENRGTEQSSSLVNVSATLKEAMVHINCSIGLIVDYIRKVAALEGEIDLCEETTCHMKNVNSFPGWAKGTEILTPGAVYFILKIERDADEKICRVVPMVTARASKIAAEIMAKISGPTKHKTSSLTAKSSLDKIVGKTGQEKRFRGSKPASKGA